VIRSKFGAAAAILYLLAFACASAYPLFDDSTFAGLPAVLLGLPGLIMFQAAAGSSARSRSMR